MDRLIIDVREPHEYAQGHVDGAINLPPSKLIDNPPQLANISRDTEIIVYCLSGSRSNSSIPYLRSMGFTNIINGINKGQVEQRYMR